MSLCLAHFWDGDKHRWRDEAHFWDGDKRRGRAIEIWKGKEDWDKYSQGQAAAFRVRFQYLTIYTPLNLYSFGFLVGPVRFVGFSFKTETELDLLEFMVLKIGLIGFLSRFGFFS